MTRESVRPAILASPHFAGRLLQVSFFEQVCAPFLRGAQNIDGSWGYQPRVPGAVEPTCWALLALCSPHHQEDFSAELKRGCNWLTATQLPDGSWPSFPGQPEGSWVTALGCLTLSVQGDAPEPVEKASRWLTQTRPGDAGFWRRLRIRMLARRSIIGHDATLYGWSWSAGTSSWVEPTAYALLALLHTRAGGDTRLVQSRRRMGEALLLDRMCPAGGWNSGNPMVYGTPGSPLIGPTAWALLALADRRDRAEVRQSLDWLERSYPGARGPASRALAHLCLQAYGCALPPVESALTQMFSVNQFLHQVPVVAWATLAMGPTPDWLQVRREARS